MRSAPRAPRWRSGSDWPTSPPSSARDRGIDLEARGGVTAGTALTADSSPPGRLPLGDVVEAAAQLARDAAPGEIVIDARTRTLLGDAARTAPATSGRFVLHGLARAAHPSTPLVGRERELGSWARRSSTPCGNGRRGS